VAQGLVIAANTGTELEASAVAMIIGKAAAFFVVAVALGGLVARRFYRWATFLRGEGVLLTISLGWMFLVAYIGMLIGLAPIVGAFAAGLVLEDVHFRDFADRDERLANLLKPLTTFLVPVFFVHMGMRVDLAVFGNLSVIGFALALTVAAVLGKQACALGVVERGLNRVIVGVGMIPRGEVGLIVAGIGASMRTADGHAVVPADAFSASVIMVIITTMVTPPILVYLFRREAKRLARGSAEPPAAATGPAEGA
jgi:Kef-type K+ transport system membrane component KefB